LLTKQVGNNCESLWEYTLGIAKATQILSEMPARVALGTHSKGCATNQRRGFNEKNIFYQEDIFCSG